ncbi:MAG: cytochrome c, partial [Flavobacteriaceae bacterium]|nr:cytochrome c [Flavobacteriaceae bacterium]
MPNMMYSEAYEAYQEGAIFPNEQTALLPVEGTVPRGYSIYAYENNPSGYNAAKEELTAKIPNTEKNLVEGKALYD